MYEEAGLYTFSPLSLELRQGGRAGVVLGYWEIGLEGMEVNMVVSLEQGWWWGMV